MVGSGRMVGLGALVLTVVCVCGALAGCVSPCELEDTARVRFTINGSSIATTDATCDEANVFRRVVWIDEVFLQSDDGNHIGEYVDDRVVISGGETGREIRLDEWIYVPAGRYRIGLNVDQCLDAVPVLDASSASGCSLVEVRSAQALSVEDPIEVQIENGQTRPIPLRVSSPSPFPLYQQGVCELQLSIDYAYR